MRRPPHETTLRLFRLFPSVFASQHAFHNCQHLLSTVLSYHHVSQASLHVPDPLFTIFSHFYTFDSFFDCFSTCFRMSPRVANPLHSYSTYNVYLRSPQPIFDLIYTKTTLSNDFWPRGTRFLPHGTRLAPVPNYRHQLSTDLGHYQAFRALQYPFCPFSFTFH